MAAWPPWRTRKAEWTLLGLISGTSMDGIDACVVRSRLGRGRARFQVLFAGTRPYPRALALRLRRLVDSGAAPLEEVSSLDAAVGRACARAALWALSRAGLSPADLDLAGSHGQTIRHLPRGWRGLPPSTLQIGDPAAIAEALGAPVVGHFRNRDVAAGGEGAPLIPWIDRLLLRPGQVALNLGGIANLTALTRSGERVIAFDAGPGNGLLDAAVRLLTRGREPFDRNGRRARRGRVSKALLARWLRHPYFRRPPPKSTGLETFGAERAGRLVGEARRAGLSGDDALATLAALTAESVARSLRRFVAPRSPIIELVASGGGVHNRTLMEYLRRSCCPWPVISSDERGIPPDHKEALGFALLAHAAALGLPANLPAVTGARKAVLLGAIYPGNHPF